MGHYKNFKTVVYCVAQSMAQITEKELQNQIDFFQHYVGVDKVYLEPFRGDVLVEKTQLTMCKKLFEKNGIEVSAGITTTGSGSDPVNKNKQRLFNTFCYCNDHMRQEFKRIIEYIAEQFDELIIDDFFFTQCTCSECQAEKGNRSWEDFRTDKMVEVSKNLVLKPARKINPDMKITIKFPNWPESYQETGYNPKEQKDLFDMIYTGTETRHPIYTDQHLPRYLSYSLMRYMENIAPNRNGGGWFDPFQCHPIDAYLEQAYLTVFSKPKEVMMFCWSALYQNKVVTPMKLQLSRLDAIMTKTGQGTGLPVYLPYNSQGEDHIEEYLGMVGIPFEPVPEFPANSPAMFLTAAAACDEGIITKLKDYVNGGGKAIVTSGFVRLLLGKGIEELTSIRYRNRFFSVNQYHYAKDKTERIHYTNDLHRPITFPLMEHRNNATWSLINGTQEDLSATLFSRDTYGEGQMYCLNVPDSYSEFKYIPQDVLTAIRRYLCTGPVYLDAPAQISLFTYDDDTFGIYSYASDGSRSEIVRVRIRGQAEELLPLDEKQGTRMQASGKRLLPLYQTADETVFEMTNTPGDFQFFKIIWKNI